MGVVSWEPLKKIGLEFGHQRWKVIAPQFDEKVRLCSFQAAHGFLSWDQDLGVVCMENSKDFLFCLQKVENYTGTCQYLCCILLVEIAGLLLICCLCLRCLRCPLLRHLMPPCLPHETGGEDEMTTLPLLDGDIL